LNTRKLMVLGATGGVGQAVARRLTAEGFEVIATCRSPAQCRELEQAGLCHHALVMRLDEPASIEAAFAELEAQGVTALAGVVNCAAITQPRPLELIAMDELRRTFEVNLFGALDALQRALPRLRACGGRIVFVSSTSGSVGVPLLGAYSASKFALEAVADVLRRELCGWGIKVSLIIPAGIKTAMIERQLTEIDRDLLRLKPGLETGYVPQYQQHRSMIELAGLSAVKPEQVAGEVLRALTDAHPKPRYLCGLPSMATRAARRLCSDWVLDRLFDRMPGSRA
jgi:NAD(P)-dependent dehydrogenase (short-subunit alcohol dehydrogenase family)